MKKMTYLTCSYAGYSGYRHPDVSREAVIDFINTLPSTTESGKCLRIDQTGSRFSYKCGLKGIDTSMYLKVIKVQSPLRYLAARVLSCSLPHISTSAAAMLSVRNISTPAVYLVLNKSAGFCKEVSYIVTGEAQPYTFIEPFIHQGYMHLPNGNPGKDTMKCKALRISQWARFVKGMHDSGCFHFDLSNYNVMTRPGRGGTDFELIDLDMMMTTGSSDSLSGSFFTAIELIIMNAMFKDRDFRKIDKLRFLRSYWGAKQFRQQMKKQWVRWVFDHGELGRSKWFRRIAFNSFRILRALGTTEPSFEVEAVECHQSQG